MLYCSDCGRMLPTSAFHKSNTSKRGYQYKCKTCSDADRNARKIAHPEKYKGQRIRQYRKTEYGVSENDYTVLGLAQDWKCGICQTDVDDLSRDLDVDHDHKTGKVRGLLCSLCNKGLGQFKDDPELLRRAIEWLSHTQ